MKKTIVPALILTAICLVVVSLLVVTNLFTEDRIAEAEKKAMRESAESVLPTARLEELDGDGEGGYVGYGEDGSVVGYVLLGAAKGYGGDVTAIVGVTPDGKITGVVIKAPDETPGLGANVSKDSFANQFEGKDKVEDYDAVSGATYSSEAAKQAINLALSKLESVKGKGATK